MSAELTYYFDMFDAIHHLPHNSLYIHYIVSSYQDMRQLSIEIYLLGICVKVIEMEYISTVKRLDNKAILSAEKLGLFTFELIGHYWFYELVRVQCVRALK